ncbi:hypothetical protein ACFZAR_43220 [Streptomyces sp. NPDC008222]|uniref:hypothetical protein n=1 Tax=Streptomyces sp. NPDC008222 TaxID=3364820 RepID=UPI0036E6A321
MTTVVEAQTIRVQIRQADKPFTEVDVQVYPWHIGNYGGNWEAWLRSVGPEWVDRMASGIRDEKFSAVATDTGTGDELADVEFTHTTSASDEFIAHMAAQDPKRLEADRAAAWAADRDDEK